MSDEVAVIPEGKDVFFDHYGNRVLFLQSGGIVVSTRDGGRVQIQSGLDGIRLTSNGVTIRVGENGMQISVNAPSVLIGTDDADDPIVKYNELKAQMDSMVDQINALKNHMHTLVGIVPGMTGTAAGLPWSVGKLTSAIASGVAKVSS